MKEKDFDIEKLLKLKELADKIKAIPDADFDEALEDEFDEAFEESGFADYEYCREIIIDGKKYDLDGEFCHDDETATGALCAVDCLVGDIEDDYQTVLKNVEKMINIRNRK